MARKIVTLGLIFAVFFIGSGDAMPAKRSISSTELALMECKCVDENNDTLDVLELPVELDECDLIDETIPSDDLVSYEIHCNENEKFKECVVLCNCETV